MTRLSSDPKMTNVLLPFVKESSENLKKNQKKITMPASHHHHAYLLHHQVHLGRLSLSEEWQSVCVTKCLMHVWEIVWKMVQVCDF